MAGTTWPALTAGEKATASKVEAKFDWIEGSLVPMIGGSKTTGAYDLGEASYCWENGYINKISAINIETQHLTTTVMLFVHNEANFRHNVPIRFLGAESGNTNTCTFRYTKPTGGTSELLMIMNNFNKFKFYGSGTALADESWSTFSPNIKNSINYKNFSTITSDNYLDWALEDAKKPIKPYRGIPRVQKNDTTGADIFTSRQEAKKEIQKYIKDPTKIAIGVARWAEQTREKIKELEKRIIALEK